MVKNPVRKKTKQLDDNKGESPAKEKRLPPLSQEDRDIMSGQNVGGAKLRWRNKYMRNPPQVIPDPVTKEIPPDMFEFLTSKTSPFPCFNSCCQGNRIFMFVSTSNHVDTMYFQCNVCNSKSFTDGEQPG